jgi:ketosteroid isomerase-like protein
MLNNYKIPLIFLLIFLLIKHGIDAYSDSTPPSPISPPPAEDITGTWSGYYDQKLSSGGIERTNVTFDFNQTDGKLDGTVTINPSGQYVITNGTVQGNIISFIVSISDTVQVLVNLQENGAKLIGQARSLNPRSPFDVDISLEHHSLSSVAHSDNSVRSPDPDLTQIIRVQDKALMDAFNSQDIKTITNLFTSDFEYYSDTEGFEDANKLLDAYQQLFESTTKYRIDLEGNSFKVYPIKKYGAVEIAIHNIYSQAPGEKEQLSRRDQYTIIWKQTQSGWQINRGIRFSQN